MSTKHTIWWAEVVSRGGAALVAGTIAIVLNTLTLDAARLVPLATDNGGLLRFLVVLTGGAFSAPASAVFQTGFHITVGFAMAFFYAFVLEPWIRVPSWLRGVLFATAVWLIYALIVLPAIGKGIAGHRDLTLAGMVWFAAAHTLFFLVLAILFPRLRETSNRRILCHTVAGSGVAQSSGSGYIAGPEAEEGLSSRADWRMP